MNRDLITQYHNSGDLKSLITLFETLIDQRDRAEFNNRVYLHEIKILATRYANITEPKTGNLVSNPEPKPKIPKPTNKSEPKSKETLDLEL